MLEAEALVQTLARLCREKDAFLLPGSPLVGADSTADGIALRTPAESIAARTVVNAAGLYADEVSDAVRRADFSNLSRAGASTRNWCPPGATWSTGWSIRCHTRTDWACTSPRRSPATSRSGRRRRYQDRKDDYEGDRIPIEDFLEPARQLLPGDHARGSPPGWQRHSGKASPS